MTDQLDTTDIETWIGRPLGRNGAKEPVDVNDIRRWAQALHNPNRLYFDEEYAAESRFGRIVAPPSFTVNCEAGHGATPAVVGRIPGAIMMIGGDEWWFFGPRIFPGDKVVVDQVSFDFRHTTTRFAGPTVIQRGDNHYVKSNGETVAMQRHSAVRFKPMVVGEAAAATVQDEPEWSDEELARVNQEKIAYVESIAALGHDPRPFETVKEGEDLPVKVLGPHSIMSFTAEWCAFTMATRDAMWSEMYVPLPSMASAAGQLESNDLELLKWDPDLVLGDRMGSGHLSDKDAQNRGMPRAFGFGASIGAWVLDYLSSYVGDWGLIEHCSTQFRGPALTGDLTYARGTITRTSEAFDPSMGRVHVDYALTNQRGEVQAKGSGELLLPRS